MEITNKFNIGDVFSPLKPKEWANDYQFFEINAIRYEKGGAIHYISHADNEMHKDLCLSEDTLSKDFKKVEPECEIRHTGISETPNILTAAIIPNIKTLNVAAIDKMLEGTWWCNAKQRGDTYFRASFPTCFIWQDYFTISLSHKYMEDSHILILTITMEYHNLNLFSIYAVQPTGEYIRDGKHEIERKKELENLLHQILPHVNTVVLNQSWFYPFKTPEAWIYYYEYDIVQALMSIKFSPICYSVKNSTKMEWLAKKWPNWPEKPITKNNNNNDER
jgi:hypothetical protein